MSDLQAMTVEHDGTRFEGLVAVPQGQGPFPTVLVMHSALGIHHQVQDKARALAALGYLAVATDVYGAAAYAEGPDGPGRAFAALMERPGTVRERAMAWHRAVAARSDVDPARMAAIGFCFGGHCVLELARGGADVRAVCSYHGLLTTHAPAEPGQVRAHVAAFCGAKDPFAPPEDIEALRAELTAAGASFQLGIYSEAEHGFTDPDAAALGRPGIAYDAMADKVSWAATLAILQEVL